MRHRALKYVIGVTIAGAITASATASFAEVVDVGPYGAGFAIGPYGYDYSIGRYGYEYYRGPIYGYYPRSYTHDIYGGPAVDLFNYEGPNRGAMERSR
jgi:hypothetical protein